MYGNCVPVAEVYENCETQPATQITGTLYVLYLPERHAQNGPAGYWRVKGDRSVTGSIKVTRGKA